MNFKTRPFTIYLQFHFQKKTKVLKGDKIKVNGQTFTAENRIENLFLTATVIGSRPMTAKERRDPFNIREAFMIESGLFDG